MSLARCLTHSKYSIEAYGMNYQLWKKLFRVKVSLDGTGAEDQEKASISGSEGKRKSRIDQPRKSQIIILSFLRN